MVDTSTTPCFFLFNPSKVTGTEHLFNGAVIETPPILPGIPPQKLTEAALRMGQRILFRKAHRLQDQEFSGEVTCRFKSPHWIPQMIEKPEKQNQVELSVQLRRKIVNAGVDNSDVRLEPFNEKSGSARMDIVEGITFFKKLLLNMVARSWRLYKA